VSSKNNSEVLDYYGPTSTVGTPGQPVVIPGKTPGVFVASGAGGLSSPEGLTFGLDGELYVTSDATNQVLRYTGPGIPFTTPGNFIEAYVPQIPGGKGQGGLDGPQGIVWGPGPVGAGNDLNLYVVGKNADTIFRYSPVPGDPQPTPGQSGTSAVYVPGGTGGLSNPQAMLLRGSDFLVTSFNNNEVLSFDAFTGAFNSVFIASGSGGLSGPSGLAVNSSNFSVYVSSQANSSILRYDGATGAFVGTLVGSGLGGLVSPTDIAVDSGSANVFATSSTSQVMRYLTSTGAPDPAAGQPAGSAIFIPKTNGTYTLNVVQALAVTNVGTPALLVSNWDPSTNTSQILAFDPSSGAFQRIFTSNSVSPLLNVQKMSVDAGHNSLYVTTLDPITGDSKVLRYNLTTGQYIETLVPLAGLVANAGGLLRASGLDYNTIDGTMLVVSSANNSVMRYAAPPAVDNPTPGNSGADFTNPGGGSVAITLLANRTNANGTSNGPTVGQSGANLGVSNITGNSTAVGTTFDDNATRAINDPGAKAPFQNPFQPEDFSGFSSLIGLPASALDGTWTLEVSDFRNNGNTPPPQFIENWSVTITSGFKVGADIGIAGNKPLPVPAPLPGRPDSAGSTVTSINFTRVGPFPNAASTPVSPDRGIGPTPVIASDNTLGAFSPFQGRLYMAYVAQGPTGTGADNTDVYLTFSDDGGVSWSKSPIKLNDDSISDGFSEGNRPQFEPELAVDQATGTLVATFYDARNDAAHARVATYIATSRPASIPASDRRGPGDGDPGGLLA